MVIFSTNNLFGSEKYESITLHPSPFPKMKEVNLLSKTHCNDKGNLKLKTVLQELLHVDRFSEAFFLQQPSHPACVLIAGTQRFFLASVEMYCSVSQDVTHNELCKQLNKNGPPKNFAKRGSDQLFLYHERKNNHFIT